MHDFIDYIERLRTLPTETAAPYNWQEFQRRAARARVVTEWRPAAVAAALLLMVCTIAVWGLLGGGRHLVADSAALEDGGRNSDQTRKPALAASGEVGGVASAGATQSESGMAAKRSRAIESWLAALPREPAVVRVGTRAAVTGLEDRIAQVDDLMTSLRIDGTRSDRLAALQQERLRLVGSLAQVRYAEVVASRSP